MKRKTIMKLKAQKRKQFKKKNKQLRKKRKIPAVVFGKDMESIPVVLDLLEFIKVYKEAGETSLIDLETKDLKEKVIVKEVQFHPVTLKPIHVGFYKVDLSKKIRANVPIKLVGEEKNELVKKGEGLALTLLNEIEVEALPTDLPSNFTIDVSELNEIGDGVTIGELDYDKEKVDLIDVVDEKLVVKMDWAEMEEIEEEEEELTEEELIEGIEVTEEAEEGEEELETEQQADEEKTEVKDNPENPNHK